jgi:hypothetical protein
MNSIRSMLAIAALLLLAACGGAPSGPPRIGDPCPTYDAGNHGYSCCVGSVIWYCIEDSPRSNPPIWASADIKDQPLGLCHSSVKQARNACGW